MKRIFVLLDDCIISAKWFEKNPILNTTIIELSLTPEKETDKYDLSVFKEMTTNITTQKLRDDWGRIQFFQLGIHINTPLEICKRIRNLAIETELKEWIQLTSSNN